MMHPPVMGIPSVEPLWTMRWTIDVPVIAVLLASVTAYTVGTVRMWRHAGIAHGVRPWQAVAHGAGIAVIAIALLSPLDHASDVLFSAHMAQHELLMLIAAPLIVLGRPLAPVMWSLPRHTRVALRHAARKRPLIRAWAVFTAPVVALALHALARWLWHVPALFDAALAHERLHAFQHLTFFATAVLFWWTLIHGRYGRVGYGVSVAFVFITLIHSGLLAAMLSFANEPLYDHGSRTIRIGMDALVDQQRAGLVMWVPAGIAMMSIGLALFAAWLGHAEKRSRAQFVRQADAPAPSAPSSAVSGLGDADPPPGSTPGSLHLASRGR
jgi:putative membrane protein